MYDVIIPISTTDARSPICAERSTFLVIQVKKKTFKINAIIEDVGLNED